MAEAKAKKKAKNDSDEGKKVPAKSEKKESVAVGGDNVSAPPAHLDSGFGEGFEGVGAEDFVVPRLVVVQPTSNLDADKGVFFSKLLNLEIPELRCRVLRLAKGRIMFDTDDLSNPPVCRSNDRIKPSPAVEDPQAEFCAKCPQREWRQNESGDNVQPCQETYNLMVLQDGIPYWLSMKGSAISPTKAFITAIGLKCKTLKGNPRDFEVTVKLEERTKKGRTYFVPSFGSYEHSPSPEADEMFVAFAKEDIERTYQKEQEMDGESEGASSEKEEEVLPF